jgi:HSP20 family protein
MLQALQEFGKELGRDLLRGWESLTDGWRELLSRSAGALTQFGRKSADKGGNGELIPADAPRWSLLAGDVVDNGHELVVRIEVPGVDKGDCDITIDGNTLIVRGEKRFDSTYVGGSYHVRQCAYGYFERVVPLPFNVYADKADAQFRNGVLVVRLPKAPDLAPRRIQVH